MVEATIPAVNFLPYLAWSVGLALLVGALVIAFNKISEDRWDTDVAMMTGLCTDVVMMVGSVGGVAALVAMVYIPLAGYPTAVDQAGDEAVRTAVAGRGLTVADDAVLPSSGDHGSPALARTAGGTLLRCYKIVWEHDDPDLIMHERDPEGEAADGRVAFDIMCKPKDADDAQRYTRWDGG